MIKNLAFDFDWTLWTAKNLSVITLSHIYKKLFDIEAPLNSFKILTWLSVKEKLIKLNPDNRELLYEEWNKFYLANYSSYIHIYEGIVDLVKTLYENNINLYILSNKKVEYINIGLEKYDILKYFNKIYGSDNVEYKKPSKEIIDYMIKDNNISSEIMLVGDSLVDYNTCINGNINFWLANWCGKDLSHIISLNPNYIFTSPLDILNIYNYK